MSFCKSCKDRKICTKVCKRLNQHLVKICPPQRDVIAETPYTNEYMEYWHANRNQNPCGGGRRTKPVRYNSNYDLGWGITRKRGIND